MICQTAPRVGVAAIRQMFGATHTTTDGTPVGKASTARNATLAALAGRIVHMATALIR
jgi:hypothetical protein